MATQRETQAPRLLLGATLLGCALVAVKFAFKGFASSLDWWTFGSVVAVAYLMVLVSLELYTDFRGPLIHLVRALRLLTRDPGSCPECGRKRVWADLDPDARPLARNAVPVCLTCVPDDPSLRDEPSYCPTCGALLPANAYCLSCRRPVRKDSES